MSRAEIHHGDNRTCPAVQHEGATHCPGHVVEVPEHGEDHLRAAVNQAFGRGFRRCFEQIRKTPALYVLIGAGAYDDAKGLLKDRLFREVGAEALTGWDSVDNDPR